MDELETTNGRLKRVLADLDELIGWAEADSQASDEAGNRDAATGDRLRLSVLQEARKRLEECWR